MSMSTSITGFKPPDEKWKKMKAIWDACEEAGVSPPEAVDKFFNRVPPDDSGVEVRIDDTVCCRRCNGEMRTGFEVLLDKIPKDVKIIRFWNTW